MNFVSRRVRRPGLVPVLALSAAFTLLLAFGSIVPAEADQRTAERRKPVPQSDVPPANGGTGDGSIPPEVCFAGCGPAPNAPPPPPPVPDNTPPDAPPAPQPPDSVEDLPPPPPGGDTPTTPPAPAPAPTTPPVTPPTQPPTQPPETPEQGAPPPPQPEEEPPTTEGPDETDAPDAPTPAPAPTPPSVGPAVPTGGPSITTGPSGTRGRRTTGPESRRVRGQATVDAETSWSIWWELNRWRYLPKRSDVLRRTAEGLTGKDPAAEILAAWNSKRQVMAQRTALPYLWKVLNPATKQSQEVRSAALISMGRLAQNEEAVDLLLHYAMSPAYTETVRQAAVVGLAHLRRSDKNAQFDATRLDLLRIQLLRVFDDAEAPVLVRAHSALAVGMLSDQPHGESTGANGRFVTRELWSRLKRTYSGNELPVALFTALGMQPSASVGTDVRDALASIAIGKRIHKRRWSGVERSHALAARVRLGGAGTLAALSRTLSARSAPMDVRRAGFLALGAIVDGLGDADRERAFAAWQAGMNRSKHPFTQGLAYVTLGRLLGADLHESLGDSQLLYGTNAAAQLQRGSRSGDTTVRGFAVLGLSIAARGAQNAVDETALAFRSGAERQLLEGLVRGKGDDHVVASHAVGLGLVGSRRAVESLTSIVRDRGRSAELRGRSAVALAQIGVRTPKLMTALRAALMDRRDSLLRQESALALSFIGRQDESGPLVADLADGRSQFTLSQVALALGQMGRLEAVPAMLKAARDDANGDETRSYAVAAMGLILNPEELRSLHRVRFDANYPARTRSLHEAFHIL